MNLKQSLNDTIKLGYYRQNKDGNIILTNGKTIFKTLPFAKTYQHFETVGKTKVYHTLDEEKNIEPWPLIELTVDFTKPYGKIKNPPLPFLNIAPEAPIKSENNSEDTTLIWNHIENLCGDVDQDVKEWVKDWIADIFQNPMQKPGTALTFRSEEGTGKGLIFDKLMSKLLGERHLSTSRSVFGERFNGEAKHKLLINFDEGSWDNSRTDIGSLKKFITDSTFSFEEKGKDVVMLPNLARTVFTSNSSWIIKNDNSRRFCMLNPIKENYCSTEYFQDLILVIENKQAVKKFLHELETRTITNNLTIIPKTEEYQNQQLISYDFFDTWLDEVLENEFATTGKDSTTELWETYTLNSKTCLGDYATHSFNEMNRGNFTTRKLFARLKNSVPKFGYTLDSVVVNENGKSVRHWEFKRRVLKVSTATQNSGQANTTSVQDNLQSEEEVEITDLPETTEVAEY
jgi:hypothetical protein